MLAYDFTKEFRSQTISSRGFQRVDYWVGGFTPVSVNDSCAGIEETERMFDH